MVNVDKLRGRIVEQRSSVTELAKQIGVDPATLYRKLGNSESFTIREADAIVQALSLSVDDAVAIFFSQYVS